MDKQHCRWLLRDIRAWPAWSVILDGYVENKPPYCQAVRNTGGWADGYCLYKHGQPKQGIDEDYE